MIKILIASSLFAAGLYGVTEASPDDLPGARGDERADCVEFIDMFIEARGERQVSQDEAYRFTYCSRIVAR